MHVCAMADDLILWDGRRVLIFPKIKTIPLADGEFVNNALI